MSRAPDSLVPAAVGLVLGALGGSTTAWSRLDASGAVAAGARTPFVWVADRDGNRVTVLDGALLPLATVTLRSPRLVAAGDGDAWVAHAPDAGAPEPTRLLRLASGGRVAAVARFAFPVSDLAADGAGGACLLEDRPGDARVWRLDASGGRRALLDVAGGRRLALRGGRVLVGCERGELVLLDAGRRPALLARRRVGTRIVDVAAGPDGFWALDASFGGRLLCLGEDLAVLGAGASRCASGRLGGGADGAWLGDAERPRLLRFDRSGALAGETAARGLRTGLAALCREARALVVATDGAVWLCDPETGAARRTQGGFDGIVDLALARR